MKRSSAGVTSVPTTLAVGPAIPSDKQSRTITKSINNNNNNNNNMGHPQPQQQLQSLFQNNEVSTSNNNTTEISDIHLKTYSAGEDGNRLAEMAKQFGLEHQRRQQGRKQTTWTTATAQMSVYNSVVTAPMRRWRRMGKQLSSHQGKNEVNLKYVQLQDQCDLHQKQHRRCCSAGDAAGADTVQELMAKAATHHQQKVTQVPQICKSKHIVHVGKLLGEGGFAQVLQVTLSKKMAATLTTTNSNNTTTTTKFALKQLRKDLFTAVEQDDKTATSSSSSNSTSLQRAADALVREAKIMTHLRGHPHILHLRATSDTLDSFFLVTDVLKETMADRLRQWNHKTTATLTSTVSHGRERLQYALQLAQALAFCHEQRIVYRDCKAYNIGFSDKHTIQLYDFGLARFLPDNTVDNNDDHNNDDEDDDNSDAQTCTSSLDEAFGAEEVFRMTMCGTQRYMAPEVYQNRGWYNTKADVYSWAMTVMELMTGKKPHSYMTLAVHKILVLEGGGRPSLEDEDLFPLGLQQILKAAWEHNVPDRWSMAQVSAAMEAYIGSDDTTSQSLAPTTVPQKKGLPSFATKFSFKTAADTNKKVLALAA